MHDNNPEAADKPVEKVIVLVHGTFAQEASWIKSDSALCKYLANTNPDVNFRFHEFQWSGDNTHRGRREAGTQLRHELLELQRRFPVSEHYVVAHSHGGNVALYALEGLSASSLVAGLICLGTPFFKVLPRDPKPAIAAVALTIVLLATAALFYAIWHYFGIETPIGFALVALPGVGIYVWNALDRFAKLDAYQSIVERIAEEAQHSARERIASPAPTTRSLIISTRGDEALAWLRSLDAFLSFAFYGWYFVAHALFSIVGFVFLSIFFTMGIESRNAGDIVKVIFYCLFIMVAYEWWLATISRGLAVRVLLISIIAAVTIGPLLGIDPNFSLDYFTDVMTIVFPFLVFVGLATLILTISLAFLTQIIRGHPLGYGWERLSDSWFNRITASSAPDMNSKVDLKKVLVGGYFRHSALYESSTVHDAINRFVIHRTGADR